MSDCRLCGQPNAELFASVEGRRYLRCPRCHLTFLGVTQLPDRADEKAPYDLHRNEPDDPGYRRFLDQLGAPLCERLGAGDRGLDFGCGPGPALAPFAYYFHILVHIIFTFFAHFLHIFCTYLSYYLAHGSHIIFTLFSHF